MLEWTGERFLPWLAHSTIAYEHLHRYAYAAMFVKGKRVLDLACGEGYGSRMMAETASFAIGVDIDEKAVQHARSKYGSEALQFVTGSISAVPVKEDHSFDVIVCFEAIEHIEDHDSLLAEVKRLIKTDGVFIVSTPNKRIYHDEARDENPFHVKELYFEEFQQLLSTHFKHVGFLGQRIHPSSSIWPIGTQTNTGFEQFVMERGETEFQFIPEEQRVPLYFIGIASDSSAAVVPPASVLLDHSDGLMKEAGKAIEWREEKISSLEVGLKWREDQLGERETTISSLDAALKWREEQIRKLNEAVDWAKSQITHMEKTIASHEEGLAWRAQQVEALETDKAALLTQLQDTQRLLQNTERRLNLATEQLEAIHASKGWKFILKVRHIRDSLRNLIGPGKSRG